MQYDPQKQHRRSIRLKNYDYASSGAYFVTIVTHQRQCLFGAIVDGAMRLNEWGAIAERCWMEIPQHYPHVILDAFVIMPNHVHGIIILNDNKTNVHVVQPKPSVPSYGVSKSGLPNGSVNIPIFTTFGNAIITNTLSATIWNCNV